MKIKTGVISHLLGVNKSHEKIRMAAGIVQTFAKVQQSP